MSTTVILIIVGVGVAGLVIIFVTKGKKKSAPPVQPRPPIDPPKPPQPPVIEPPVVRPSLPTITFPPAPPMPEMKSGPIDQVHISNVDDLDIGRAIMSVQNLNYKEIIVDRSGELRTPVILQPNTHLRIAASVEIRCLTREIPFRLMEHTSIIGGEGSVIHENESGHFEVIAGFYGSKRNGDPDEDITLYGFEIRGSNRKDFNSTPQAISLGNCKKFSIIKVFINGTHSIGIQAGGGSFFGHHAEDGIISHCRLEHVASQSIAVVNGRRIKIEYNSIINPGQENGPGSHPIDLEPNSDTGDALYDISIKSNFIDQRDAAVFGNGIIVQTAGKQMKELGKFVIEDNVLLGGHIIAPNPQYHGWLSNGIYIFGPGMRDVQVRRNKVWRATQAGIHAEGDGIIIDRNELVDAGGGGIEGVRLISLKNSQFTNNVYRSIGDGPNDNRILFQSSDNVKFEGNSGFAP